MLPMASSSEAVAQSSEGEGKGQRLPNHGDGSSRRELTRVERRLQGSQTVVLEHVQERLVAAGEEETVSNHAGGGIATIRDRSTHRLSGIVEAEEEEATALVGEACMYAQHRGDVEENGWRATRMSAISIG